MLGRVKGGDGTNHEHETNSIVELHPGLIEGNMGRGAGEMEEDSARRVFFQPPLGPKTQDLKLLRSCFLGLLSLPKSDEETGKMRL